MYCWYVCVYGCACAYVHVFICVCESMQTVALYVVAYQMHKDIAISYLIATCYQIM